MFPIPHLTSDNLNNLLQLPEECWKGYEGTGKECLPCPLGTFNDKMGSGSNVAGPVQKDRPLTKLEAANAVCIKQLTKVDNI